MYLIFYFLGYHCRQAELFVHLQSYFAGCALKLESVQDFLIKLDMKPCMYLVEINTFSLNLVIVRPTKIMNRADKNWAQFQETKYLKNQTFQKIFVIKVGLLIEYSS